MNKVAIDDAYELARKFMERVDLLRSAEKGNYREIDGHIYSYDSPRHRGAVRRASMDLTRALADMRRPS